MTRTFLIALDLGDDTTDLNLIANEIQDDLEAGGYAVESVKVWQSPNEIPIPGLPLQSLGLPPAEPPPTPFV